MQSGAYNDISKKLIELGVPRECALFLNTSIFKNEKFSEDTIEENIRTILKDNYQAYNKRKEINEKLKAQIKEICPILIKGSIEEAKRGCKNVPAAIWKLHQK